ncbi:MAG TPA: Hsp20/alpha crystallin family protein, partial [bacterium]
FEEEVNEGSFTRFERQYGSFERRFSLPKNINDGDVKADYRNGILTLTVPKTEEAKPKSIKIDVN